MAKFNRSNIKKDLFNYKNGGISNNICVTYNKHYYLNSNINYNIN